MHQSLLAVWAAAAVLLVPACGGGGSDDAGEPPPTSSAPTTTMWPTTTTPSPTDEVKEAYSATDAMLERITTTTVDPNDPELAMRIIDPELSAVRTQLSTWQAQGQVWVAGDQTRHDIESIGFADSVQTATVKDCVVANDALVAVGDTTPSFPPPVAGLVVTTMVKQDGRWLLQNSDPIEGPEGQVGCTV